MYEHANTAVIMRANAPGRYFQRTRAKSGEYAPSKQKCEKRPGHTVNAPPPSNYWGKRAGAELASNLSVGNGEISEAGKGVLYIGMLRYSSMGRHMFLRNSQTDIISRGQSRRGSGRRRALPHGRRFTRMAQASPSV